MTAAFLALMLVASGRTPTMLAMKEAGPWNVEFADKLCVLSRPYSAGDQKLTLSFKAELVGRSHEFMIVRSERSPSSTDRSEVFVVKPGGAKVGPFYARSYSTAGGHRISRFRVASDKYELTEDGDRLAIHLGKQGAYHFPVPTLGKALGVLEECIRDLRKDYLIDQAILDLVAVEAKVIDLGFGANDYPSEALRANAQGDVGTLLWVDAKGRVSDCTVVESSGVESLDTATCTIFRRRTRYDPARDAQGNAIRAPTYYRLKWELPN